ncbi:MAG: hypothetical protein J6M21_08020, partial [Campylobacter sp.]|nr:hypothetical protein [Campylobacter sp.]
MDSKIRQTIKPLFISLVASFFIAQVSAETVSVSSGGKAMFDLVFLDNYDSDAGYDSTGTLTQNQKRVVQAAAQLWADILASATTNRSAAKIRIIGENAGTSASYLNKVLSSPYLDNKYTALQYNLLQGAGRDDSGAMYMGTQVVSDTSLIDEPSMVSKRDVMATTIHEIGHGLGVTDTTMGDKIVDIYGRNLKDNENSVKLNAGEFMDSGITFRGANTLAVLGDEYVRRMNGLPVNGSEYGTFDGSHFELDNSLQSHQMWRNWVFFMEAELAVLKDIGYDIDLKNIYGKSIYGDNQNVNYTDGFFARNGARTAYLIGNSNIQTYGIGLHIYGKNNTVTVSNNDLKADGKASAGVRIDGSDNIFTLSNGTRVTANGINGMGIYTAFGKDHTLNIDGEIEATGKNGIGIRADFGSNTLGDNYEIRGSHYRWEQGDTYSGDLYNSKSDPTQGGKYANQTYDNRTPEMDLDGALIKDLNINGKVTANKVDYASIDGANGGAAVYIAKNSHVENINIGSGANITGNIVSDWDKSLEWLYDEKGNTYYSAMFLKSPNGNVIISDKDGNELYRYYRCSNKADCLSRVDYRTTLGSLAGATNAVIDGNIVGNKSIDIVNQGDLTVNGYIDTLSFTNAAIGTLTSSDTGGILVNNRTEGYEFNNTGTLNAKLITANSTINYSNTGDMSGGSIVAEGKNTLNTTNLGKLGGMNLMTDSATNNSTANSVLKLSNVSKVDLTNQVILVSEQGSGTAYALSNSSGRLDMLLGDTKINDDKITGLLKDYRALEITD